MSNQQTAVTCEPNKPSSPSSNAWASTKLQTHHRDRLAFVYIRQSSPQQVLDHQESTARQYALVDFAVQLGWPPDQVEVIDEDQGLTGATAEMFDVERLKRDWRYNLEAEPKVELQMVGERYPGRAERLSDAEKEEVWDKIRGVIPMIYVYEKRTDRNIRVFRLVRTGPNVAANG